jgi:hypothetical protein
MPMQRDDITLTADDHGADRARRGAAAATGGPGPGRPPRRRRRPWPLLIGAWKRKEQP